MAYFLAHKLITWCHCVVICKIVRERRSVNIRY